MNIITPKQQSISGIVCDCPESVSSMREGILISMVSGLVHTEAGMSACVRSACSMVWDGVKKSQGMSHRMCTSAACVLSLVDL